MERRTDGQRSRGEPVATGAPATAGASAEERPSLTIVRRYAAPPERVWRAWTDPQALKQWFTPGSSTDVTATEIDLREGGRYHLGFREGSEQHDVYGVYQVVQPFRRLSFTWAWRTTPERESLVTIELSPAGAGTEMVFRHERFFDTAARDRHRGGWTSMLDKLDRLLA